MLKQRLASVSTSNESTPANGGWWLLIASRRCPELLIATAAQKHNNSHVWWRKPMPWCLRSRDQLLGFSSIRACSRMCVYFKVWILLCLSTYTARARNSAAKNWPFLCPQNLRSSPNLAFGTCQELVPPPICFSNMWLYSHDAPLEWRPLIALYAIGLSSVGFENHMCIWCYCSPKCYFFLGVIDSFGCFT